VAFLVSEQDERVKETNNAKKNIGLAVI